MSRSDLRDELAAGHTGCLTFAKKIAQKSRENKTSRSDLRDELAAGHTGWYA